MACNCQIFNTTPNAIVAGVIYHSSSIFTAGGGTGDPIAIINPNGSVPDGCTALSTINGNNTASATFVAQQEELSLDYWAGWVSFEGDSTQYVIDNGALPLAECDVPDGGSMSLVVFGTGPGNTLQINTYSNSDWTDGDGSCEESLLSVADATALAELWSDFIEALLG